MGRPSQSQPGHRRPSWAKKDSTYKTYISRATVRHRASGDYGLDNFSYDEVYLAEWQMPHGLIGHLTQELRDAATNWVFAGAALCTALERVERMQEETVHRADPAITHKHLLGRRASDLTEAVVGAETPTRSSSTSSGFSTPTSVADHRKDSLMHPVPQLPVNMMGMESPPFTPVDTRTLNTPAPEPLSAGSNVTPPDLDSVTAQLSPFSTRSMCTTGSSGIPTKDDKAWEYFVGSLNEETTDLRRNALMRLKGYSRTIDTTCTELAWDHDINLELKASLEKFVQWWKVMKPKVTVYQERVEALEKKVAATKSEVELLAGTMMEVCCSI
ncbi:hypothetical protein LTR37_005295 [Vermiconidia calcicola]|uniref:Uncharacterized protein n=1 Tax=Vermiconidia calcicola TaxID=1690605 RepID=A0ACC3NKB0_9PEZI|nr:hypothetical protein LTR37_005295 [Vermiconidia calcicola]